MLQVPDLILSKYQHALEEELRETFAGRDGLLYKMLAYQLGWTDEQGTPVSGHATDQFLPYLCLLSCEGLGSEYQRALPCASAIELVRNFSLIHEEVQSGSPNRGHRPTLWWVWGPGQAINAGDGMHALARLALMRLKDQGLSTSTVLSALNLLDQACLKMFEGQHLDLAFQERVDITVKSYLDMASAKSGALLSGAMGLGALVATDDEKVVDTFKECGKNIGITWQIKQDIEDIWGAENGLPSANLLNKKKLLPIIYVMETGEIRTKRELGTIYFKRILEPQDVEHIVGILDGASARQFAEEQVAAYWQQSMDSINGIELSEWGSQELEKLGQLLTSNEA